MDEVPELSFPGNKQLCCRLVRGFALDGDEAFTVLASCNARCQPPWTDAETVRQVASGAAVWREPIGGLL